MTAPTPIFFQQMHRPPGTPVSGGRAFAGLAYPQTEPQRWFQQTWDERLNYSVGLSLPLGDSITSATATSDDPRFMADGVSVSGSTVTFWATGGTPGTFYEVRVTASTAGGLTLVKVIHFFVVDGVIPSVAAVLSGGGQVGSVRGWCAF